MAWLLAGVVLLAPGIAPAAPGRSVSVGARFGFLAIEDSVGAGYGTGVAAGVVAHTLLWTGRRLSVRAALSTLHAGTSRHTQSLQVSRWLHALAPALVAGVQLGPVEPFVSLAPVAWLVVTTTTVDGVERSASGVQVDVAASLGVRGKQGPIVARIELTTLRRGTKNAVFAGFSTAWSFDL